MYKFIYVIIIIIIIIDGTPTPPPGTPTLPANCNAREENGIIVFTCSSAGTEQISSITYRVNGGGEINGEGRLLQTTADYCGLLQITVDYGRLRKITAV